MFCCLFKQASESPLKGEKKRRMFFFVPSSLSELLLIYLGQSHGVDLVVI